MKSAVWLCLVLAACTGKNTINCALDDDCIQGGIPGRCEASPSSIEHWCAFGDSTCSGGLRWGAAAGDDLAQLCVDLPDAAPDATPEVTPDAHPAGVQAYDVASLSYLGDCEDVGVNRPVLAGLELAPDGSALSIDGAGARIAAQWVTVAGGIELRGLKIFGWAAGTVQLGLGDSGQLSGTITWQHGDLVCHVVTVATPQ